MIFPDTSPITFPGLGIEINPSSGFSVFGFEIRWYGVIIALGMLLAVIYCSRRSKEFGLTSDDILNVVIVGLPCAIIGARLYYVVFEWDSFSALIFRGINSWISARADWPFTAA